MVGSGKIIWIRIRNTDISDRLKRWEFKGDGGGGEGEGKGVYQSFQNRWALSCFLFSSEEEGEKDGKIPIWQNI